MTIPPLLVFAAGIALVIFIGGTMAGLHSLRRRVKALEDPYKPNALIFAAVGSKMYRMRLDGSDATVIYDDPEGRSIGGLECGFEPND